jgi:predicted nuclease of predicted toxin-antitoxin system
MTHKLHKYKLLLDENFPRRIRFPKLNELYDVKHIVLDLGKRQGLADPDVYEVARNHKRIVITRNISDFRDLPKPADTAGVIGVSGNLTYEQIDTKLVAFLKKATPKSLYGAFHYISGESK